MGQTEEVTKTKQVAGAAAGLAVLLLLAVPTLVLAQGEEEQEGPPPQLLLSNATTYYTTATDKVQTGAGDPTTDFHEAIRYYHLYMDAVQEMAFEDSVSIYSKIADAHWKLSDYASRNGGETEWEQAYELYQWLIERDPPTQDLAYNYFQAGWARVQLEGYAPAMEYFETYLELRPDDLGNQIWVAQLYLSISNPSAALDHYLYVFERDPDYPEVEQQVLNLRLRLELRYEEITRALVEKRPETPQYEFDLARFYLRQARFEEGVEYLQSYLAKRPDDLEALQAMADEYIRRGNWVEAHAVFDHMLEVEPRNINTLCSKAYTYLQQNNIMATIRWAQRALNIDSEHPYANRLMGDAGQQWALNQFAEQHPDRDLSLMTYDFKLLMKRFADEYYEKAKNDPSQRSHANQMIQYLSQFFPQPQDQFMWDRNQDPNIQFPPPR